MPRRVNLVMLLGLITVSVLSLGLTAGAQTAGTTEDDLLAAQEELTGIMMQKGAAEAASSNATNELNELNNEISATTGELAEADARLAESQERLSGQAQQMYVSGNVAFLDVLVGAEDFTDFTNRVTLWAQILVQEQAKLQELQAARDVVAAELDERQTLLDQRAATVADSEAQQAEAEAQEAASQEFLASLSEDLRAQLEAEQARQAEEARAIGEQALRDLEAQQAAAEQLAAEQLDAAQAQELEAAQAAAEEAASQAALAAEEKKAERQAAEQAAAQAAAAQQARLDAQNAAAAERDAALAAAAEAEEQARIAAQEAAAAREATEQAEQAAAQQREAAQQALAEQAAAAQEVLADEAATEQQQQAAAAQQALAAKAAPVQDTAGVVNPGDQFRFEGEYTINDGATVTLQDSDGTQATAIDNQNASIIEGSIVITITEALDATGGDGQLSDQGLTIADMTGITADSGEAVGQEATKGALTPPGSPTPMTTDSAQPASGDNTASGPAPSPGSPTPTTTDSAQPASGDEAAASKPAPSTASAPTASASGSAIIQEALTYMGTPYIFEGPCERNVAVDCSCFTMLVFGKFGIVLQDDPVSQYGMGTPVDGPPQAGDLVFWNEGGAGITHVGIATGNGTTIHASAFAGYVTETDIDLIPGYVGAKRLI
ncbi:MAG: hypothetical protein AVDCRST_MAG14-691 [uncultured Rubrobacteraceae bacterium]|uniref:NlpC/P60 domain-containing protein n=1 Tax=uncultured Rubrobacteraceae bacterium TaxID=349277 RepID=A0A6J4QM51_9ACTN|nr:MAG: hypothetical protein AVDCRST_MAG14-691 [uncultured Rubrobacteraceae bacterium]